MDVTAAHLDRISALPDDLLHVILSFLGDATAVTRTALLSRRWRHVWVHAKSLSFYDDRLKKYTEPGHFSGFVDWALAQRGDADMESLKIRFSENGRTSPVEKINEWLRYSARHVVESLDVHLGPPLLGQPDQLAVELPSHGKAASMQLGLSNHRFQFQAAASYEALTDLNLLFPLFVQETPTLGDFVTSSCPRLRRLQIIGAKGLPQLVLRAEALEELKVSSALDLQTLDVTAPNLYAIGLNLCFDMRLLSGAKDVVISDDVVRIVAPRLEEIGGDFRNRRPHLDIHDLTKVRRLNGLKLAMHGKYYRAGDVGFWLLDNCPNVKHVQVSVQHGFTMSSHLVDLTSEGKAPFANVRTMVVRHFRKPHLMASISALLMRCPHLISLTVDISSVEEITVPCICDALTDRCTIHGKITLESLQNVSITGFCGTDEEMQLVGLLFGSPNSIQQMALLPPQRKPHHDVSSKRKRVEEGDGDCSGMIGQGLAKISGTDRGRWQFAEMASTWMWYATESTTFAG